VIGRLQASVPAPQRLAQRIKAENPAATTNVSHRKSETIEVDGLYYNVTTSTNKAREKEIRALVRGGKGFPTLAAAVAQSKRRSDREIPPGYRKRNKTN